ncbi:hypothetical protein [Plasmodium yoelii yoelii]|uniref:Uncharacterized protein n=1 Tax=Plasmodium yoelii yoelii TaxID=73239 RepID=Q7RJI1_PLAYO|nr:hypothetical protein [Plasmodium yoelii yoelii]
MRITTFFYSPSKLAKIYNKVFLLKLLIYFSYISPLIAYIAKKKYFFK